MAMFKKRPIRRKAKRAPRRKTTGVSLAVKKYVKRTIATNVENKIVNFNQSLNFGSSDNNSTLYVYPILPYTGYGTIGQGITQGTRIGNQIKLRKVMLNYIIRPAPYDAVENTTPVPCEVEMYLGRVKSVPGELPNTADMGLLYQLGASTTGPSGDLSDVISDINTDYWLIKKRWRHKIGYSNNQGTGANNQFQFGANNDFKLNVVKKLNITKLCPPTLKFNDSNNTVQGPNLFFFYEAISATGASLAATQKPCHIDYWITIQYEDA